MPFVPMFVRMMEYKQKGIALLGNRGLGAFSTAFALRSFYLDLHLPRAWSGLILIGLVKPCPYRHNDWGEERPAEFPPDAGPGANHLLDVVIEPVDTCDIWSKNRREGELWRAWAQSPPPCHFITVLP